MSAYLLKNGLIFDGDGAEPFTGDVLLRDGQVAEVSRSPISAEAKVYDVTGQWVMPGFLDIHTHYDAEVEVMPSLEESLRHGVTTCFMGSCGLSLVMGDAEDLSDMFTRVEGIPSRFVKPLIKEIKNWDSPSEYFDHLRTLKLGPNMACMLGHSTIRAAVMGTERSLTDNEQPTKEELARMTSLVEEALDCGYLGMSINSLELDKMDGEKFRSMPTPSVFADWSEYAHLFKPLRKRGAVLQAVPSRTSLLHNGRVFWESAGILGPELKVSMLAVADSRAMRGAHRAIAGGARFINKMFSANVKVQAVPDVFDLFIDGLEAPIFEEFGAGTRALGIEDADDRKALLNRSDYRSIFRKEWEDTLLPRMFHRNLEETEIVECPDQFLIGQSFGTIAAERKQDPLQTFLDLNAQHGNMVRWRTVVANDRPEELAWIIEQPDVQIGFSDAGAHLRNMAHYNFPLQMLNLVNKRKQAGRPGLTIAQAVRRMTSELSDWFGLDVGRLAAGKKADVVVIDPAQLDDRVHEITEAELKAIPGFERLVRRNEGTVSHVFVSGEEAFADGKAVNPGAGQLLAAPH